MTFQPNTSDATAKLNVSRVICPSLLDHIARKVRDAGGQALVIGGFVRDHFLKVDSKDIDVEVFGLELDVLEQVLSSVGTVQRVGRAFGVLQVKGLPIDFSLPRKDSKIGAGHTGFDVELDPTMSHKEAARRRDLTFNCMGWDPLTEQLFDPFGGRQDIEHGVLSAVDKELFSEDPLRGLRVAQFTARFPWLTPNWTLTDLCSKLDLSELSSERLLEEFRKLLLKGMVPSKGLQFLADTKLVRFFPELEALIGCEQDPEWHPEGDVWVHTLSVVDHAVAYRGDVEDPEALMFGALCHDLGKPSTTEFSDGHIRSHGHDSAGVPLAEEFLGRMRASKALVRTVGFLVANHLAPAQLVNNEHTTAKAYRRLARKADEAGTNLKLLERINRSDRLGTQSEKALQFGFPEGEKFLEVARELQVELKVPAPVVMGRHLILRGMNPGKEFGPILARCRDIQDEFGWEDPDQILDRVLTQ